MAGPIQASVPLSFLEYRAFYRDPLFGIWGQHGPLVQAVFKSFRPWNIGLENVSWKESPQNASEILINFNLLNWKAVFGIGIGSSSLVVNNPNWSELELISKVLHAGLGAVLESAKTEIDRQLVTISMHLTPQGISTKEITANFVRPGGTEEIIKNIKGFGFSIYGEDGFWVVDLSASYPESLFVRITHGFSGSTTIEQIAKVMDNEETQLLQVLNMHVD